MSALFTHDEAIAPASATHAGQFDKAGRPYLEHPLRVNGEHEQMAVLDWATTKNPDRTRLLVHPADPVTGIADGH